MATREKMSILSKLRNIKDRLPNPSSFSSATGFALGSVISVATSLMSEAKNAFKEEFDKLKKDWHDFIKEMQNSPINERSSIGEEKIQEAVSESPSVGDKWEQEFDPLGITGCRTEQEYKEKCEETSKEWDKKTEVMVEKPNRNIGDKEVG